MRMLREYECGGVYTYMKWSHMLSSLSRIQAEGQGSQMKCSPTRKDQSNETRTKGGFVKRASVEVVKKKRINEGKDIKPMIEFTETTETGSDARNASR